MRYVQSLPPIVEPAPDSGATRGIAHTAPVRPVSERSLPPLVFRQHTQQQATPALNRQVVPHSADNDRRKFCRRIRNDPVLLELRSGQDRRRRNQRRGDLTTAIDDEA